MYVGLFGHSAVVFHVFVFFHVFYVLPTVCVVVFFQRHLIDLFSCIAASLLINLLTYLKYVWPTRVCSHTQGALTVHHSCEIQEIYNKVHKVQATDKI